MKRLIIGTSVVFALCASTAAADVIIGNLGDTSGGGTLFGDAASTQYKAAGFTMPDGPDYFLDSVILTIAAADNGGMPNMQLWEGVGQPQTMLVDIPDFVFGDVTEPTDFEWTPDGQVVLEAGKTYWVYMDNGGGGPSWLWDSGSTEPTGIATSAGFHFNGNPSSFMNTYQVNGTPVPAPAGLFALLGAAAIRRRRRRA